MIQRPSPSRRKDRGSALVMALFVVALLTGLGTALLFLSQHETRMSLAGLRSKEAFFLAESALEDARMHLYAINTDNDVNDELDAAGGADDVIDFNIINLGFTYDSNGDVVGLTGYGDDVPLRPLQTFVDTSTGRTYRYAAFLNNDPWDGVASETDSNSRVMLTGIGAGQGGSLEIVQGVVEPYKYVPPTPPAAITLLGPNPSFDNGNSNAQNHTGNDCGLGSGAYAPVVGVIGSTAVGQVRATVNRPDTFDSGPFHGLDTVGNLNDASDPIVSAAGNGTIDPAWTDCQSMRLMIENLAINAHYYCNTDFETCAIPSTAQPDEIVFIDGDLPNTPPGAHTGILVVTGTIEYQGNTGWDGILLIVGEGNIIRSGGGNAVPSGGLVVANLDPSPDGPRADKSDWCSGGSDGFMPASYTTSGAGNSEVRWCSGNIDNANSVRTYKVVSFVQR